MKISRRLPESFYNPLSIAGAALAVLCFLVILFLSVVQSLLAQPPAYMGIISYVAMPIPLLFGVVLIVVGIVRERRRKRRGLPASRLSISIDLGNAAHRRAVTVLGTGLAILFLFTVYGSYWTFEWTESVEFCGTTCHEVMEPEHTAYQHSPHARVKCVDCHVGSGAGWYVRSKLSGAYQVYAVLANVYERPIPTPISNLRPAQDICEQCHWPSHFAGEKKVVNTYFKSDERNTRWSVALLMKTGGGSPDRGPAGGIHWHMNINNEISYAAVDTGHQEIPLVRVHNRTTGATMEFTSSETSLSAEQLRALPLTVSDCITCHNRPSHVYRPPVRIVDQSLATGRISTELPGVRSAAIAALVAPYSTAEAAMDSIPKVFEATLASRSATVLADKPGLVAAAVGEIKSQYSRNFFPRMRVNWQAYPNNIGHMTDLGCFRCHDGKHVSPDGKVISKDCNSCHTILYQGTDAVPSTLTLAGLPFQHPEDVGDAWMEMNCKECHTGQ